MLSYGISRVRERNRRLAGVLREEISRIPGAVLYGPDDSGARTSIVPFNIEGHEPDDVVRRLYREGIVVAAREMGPVKMLRASPHIYNTEEEMVRTADALRRL